MENHDKEVIHARSIPIDHELRNEITVMLGEFVGPQDVKSRRWFESLIQPCIESFRSTGLNQVVPKNCRHRACEIPVAKHPATQALLRLRFRVVFWRDLVQA